jgi:hypothetical protein
MGMRGLGVAVGSMAILAGLVPAAFAQGAAASGDEYALLLPVDCAARGPVVISDEAPFPGLLQILIQSHFLSNGYPEFIGGSDGGRPWASIQGEMLRADGASSLVLTVVPKVFGRSDVTIEFWLQVDLEMVDVPSFCDVLEEGLTVDIGAAGTLIASLRLAPWTPDPELAHLLADGEPWIDEPEGAAVATVDRIGRRHAMDLGYWLGPEARWLDDTVRSLGQAPYDPALEAEAHGILPSGHCQPERVPCIEDERYRAAEALLALLGPKGERALAIPSRVEDFRLSQERLAVASHDPALWDTGEWFFDDPLEIWIAAADGTAGMSFGLDEEGRLWPAPAAAFAAGSANGG